LQLMRACQANFSPLFSLYQDTEQKIASLLAEASQVKPIIETSVPSPLMGEGQGEGGESHIVWAITDSNLIRQIKRFLAAQPLYMADGHHRYETALTYQQEYARRANTIGRFAKGKNKGVILSNSIRYLPLGNKSIEFAPKAQYVMMELVEFSDPGLVILPLHRLVHGVAPPTLAGIKEQLEDFFTLEFVPLTEVLSYHYGPFASCHSEPFTSCHSERSEESHIAQDMVLGILGLDPQSLVIVKQREDMPIEAMMPSNRSQVYKSLNVSILDHIILERILGFSHHCRSGALAPEEENIAYTVDIDEAYQQIKGGEYQLAFLLNPLQPEMVKAVADAKDRMPRKSTYFYPKLPTGLIINSLSF